MTTNRRPQLADIHCSKISFEPGDRVKVDVYRQLTDSEKKKLRRIIEKWAGCELRILIVDRTCMEVNIERVRVNG